MFSACLRAALSDAERVVCRQIYRSKNFEVTSKDHFWVVCQSKEDFHISIVLGKHAYSQRGGASVTSWAWAHASRNLSDVSSTSYSRNSLRASTCWMVLFWSPISKICKKNQYFFRSTHTGTRLEATRQLRIALQALYRNISKRTSFQRHWTRQHWLALAQYKLVQRFIVWF